MLRGSRSGNPLFPHYDDQHRMWADGAYEPPALSIDAGATIRFVPADAEGSS